MHRYLDHNASSPLHPQVLEAMLPYLSRVTGNASSLHSFGRLARSAIETARSQLAELLNCPPESIIFTSGGSEANNLALKGFACTGQHELIVSSEIEHASVLQPLAQLEQAGCQVLRLRVNRQGQIDLAAAQALLRQHKPQILSVQLANNETGVVQPVEALLSCVAAGSCMTHTDATQVIGKLPLDFQQLGVDALTMSAHKLQGPQGIGALVVKHNPRQALISGGGQEKNRRAGTESVAMIVGMGKAAQIAGIEMQQRHDHLCQLRDTFENGLAEIPGVVIFGQDVERLPNTSFFSLPYYHGETLLMELDRSGFALASGSACHSQVTQPSHVLSAMGVSDSLALNAIRVSFGATSTLQDVEALLARLHELINNLPMVMRQAVG